MRGFSVSVPQAAGGAVRCRIIGQMTQRAALAVAAHCIARRSALRWPSQRIASPVAACCNRHRSAVACLEDTLCGFSRRLYKSLCEVMEISVCRLRTAVRSLWMAIQSLCMCIQSLQTEILVSFAEDFNMLRERFQHASRAISVSFTDGFGRFRG